jgi:hypothetical protein
VPGRERLKYRSPVLSTGDVLPDAVVFAAPGEPVDLRGLAEGGTVLFLFYLFDWSGT